MSKKRGIFAVLRLSTVLDLCKRTSDQCRRRAERFANRLRNVGQENPSEVAGITNFNQTLQVDFAGKPVELREFVKRLSIGDRIRVFCDDGVVVAEKVSATQFKEIHAVAVAELVH